MEANRLKIRQVRSAKWGGSLGVQMADRKELDRKAAAFDRLMACLDKMDPFFTLIPIASVRTILGSIDGN